MQPEAHSSLVGGSTAARRIGCPRSHALEQGVPDNSSVYADQGSALHAIMAELLLNADLDPYALLPYEWHDAEKDSSYTLTEKEWEDLGQPALDAFLDFMDRQERETGGEFVYLVEQRCAFPRIEGSFGTSDVIWRCGYRSGIVDWKFGYKEVSPEENEQEMFYGRAAMSDHPGMFLSDGEEGINLDREIHLSIFQPQQGGEKTWVTSARRLQDFAQQLRAAVDEIKRDGACARIAKGPWCDFARCKAVCPLWRDPAKQLADKMAALKDTASERERKLSNEPDFIETLPDLLELAGLAESWAREVFSQAHSIVESGTPVPGWRLKPKKSSGRGWLLPEDEALKKLRNRGFKLDEIAPRKLLTAPKAADLLEKHGKKVPEDWMAPKPSRGTTLVRSDDPSPEYETNSARVRALGGKLRHLNGGT